MEKQFNTVILEWRSNGDILIRDNQDRLVNQLIINIVILSVLIILMFAVPSLELRNWAGYSLVFFASISLILEIFRIIRKSETEFLFSKGIVKVGSRTRINMQDIQFIELLYSLSDYGKKNYSLNLKLRNKEISIENNLNQEDALAFASILAKELEKEIIEKKI